MKNQIFLTASSVVYRRLRNDFDTSCCCSCSCLSGTFVKRFGNYIAKKLWKWHCQKALEMILPKSFGNGCQNVLEMTLPKVLEIAFPKAKNMID